MPQGCSKRCPARPQPKKAPEAYPLGYVEEAFEARTPLADFFSILLARELADSISSQVRNRKIPKVFPNRRPDRLQRHRKVWGRTSHQFDCQAWSCRSRDRAQHQAGTLIQNRSDRRFEALPDFGVDRIADDEERCHIIPTPGEAYRFRQSARHNATPFDDRPT